MKMSTYPIRSMGRCQHSLSTKILLFWCVCGDLEERIRLETRIRLMGLGQWGGADADRNFQVCEIQFTAPFFREREREREKILEKKKVERVIHIGGDIYI